jgi:hypothetical protein
MNLTFVLLGAAAIIDGWKCLGLFWFHDITIVLLGISLIACAFFQHAPIVEGIPFNIKDDYIHSLFAKLTGFTFTTFAIATRFILKGWFQKSLAVLVGITAMLLSILMFEVDRFMEIFQRLIFINTFGWLLFAFKRIKRLI